MTDGDAPRDTTRNGRAGPAPEGGSTKRSQTVSTVLVAGAGLAALGIGSVERGAPVRDVLVYADAAACTAEAIRTPEACRTAYVVARAAYPSSAPHYASERGCEDHHGGGHCLTDPSLSATEPLRFVPRMAGYLLGRRAEDDVTPEPVFEHQGGHGGHAGAYCTGSGGRISTGGGSHGSSATLKPSATKATRFGGFGNSGRGFSFFGGS